MQSTYTILFFIILFFRLIFIILFPTSGGDYEIYSTVAENILNGCGVSLSDPLNNECIPHFGGNHGPGYPFFLSTIWYFFNHSDFAVRLIQAIIYGISCIWLLKSIYKLSHNKNLIKAIGITLALSPLLIAWPRYVQTETLSLSATIFLIAEIFISISNRKIRIIPIGLALIFATWIRLDNIFLTVPVGVTAIWLHGFKNGIIKGLLIACILASSWGAWTARNIIVDLPSIYPGDMVMPDGSRSPKGYLAWTKTWITHEYERPGALWGINRKNYDNINIPERAYNSKQEKEKVQTLLNELILANKQDFPIKIDDAFQKIADKKLYENPIRYWFTYPAIRAIRIWTNPFSSFGWPNEMPHSGLSKNDRLKAAKGNKNILIQKAIEFPMHALSKGFNFFYRIILMTLLGFSLLRLIIKKNEDDINLLGLATISYILARTLFFSLNSNFETRYMITTIPFIEIFVLMSIMPMFKKKK